MNLRVFWSQNCLWWVLWCFHFYVNMYENYILGVACLAIKLKAKLLVSFTFHESPLQNCLLTTQIPYLERRHNSTRRSTRGWMSLSYAKTYSLLWKFGWFCVHQSLPLYLKKSPLRFHITFIWLLVINFKNALDATFEWHLKFQ